MVMLLVGPSATVPEVAAETEVEPVAGVVTAVAWIENARAQHPCRPSLRAGVQAQPSAQVANSQRLFLLFGALFVSHAVCILTDPSLTTSIINLYRL